MSVRFVIFAITVLLLFSMIGFFYFGSAINKSVITSAMVKYISNLTDVTINERSYTFSGDTSPFPNSRSAPETTKKESNETVKDWMKQMEDKYRMINERIRMVCQRYRKKNGNESNVDHKYIEQNILKNMMLDVNHKLAYCRHGKVRICYEGRPSVMPALLRPCPSPRDRH